LEVEALDLMGDEAGLIDGLSAARAGWRAAGAGLLRKPLGAGDAPAAAFRGCAASVSSWGELRFRCRLP